MSAPTPTVSPVGIGINQWLTYSLGGQNAPGTIPRGGVRGFKRETGWDKKLGKGTQGATLTLKTMPPVEGEITSQLFTDADFENWDTFVANILSIQPSKQKATGIPIYYPGFASIALVAVVIKDYTPPEHVGKGLYHVKVQLLEWQQPPPVSIVSTVSKVNYQPSRTSKLDPEVAKKLQELNAARQAQQP
jgi:hypothetical protein